jgi:hypothetical protein
MINPQERRDNMKKSGKTPKNVKKKEVKKEAEAQPQVINGQTDGKDLSKEAEKGKEKVPKASKPKTSSLKRKFPQNIESFIRENTKKGKAPKDLIPTVAKMFEEIKPLEEKASKKKAMWAIWQVRHDMGVTRKSK